VPPVAIRSSTTRARSSGPTAPTCISMQSVPYSRAYFSDITSPAQKEPLWMSGQMLYQTIISLPLFSLQPKRAEFFGTTVYAMCRCRNHSWSHHDIMYGIA
jgi:hypothetical protein